MKLCKKCNTVKPMDEFHNKKGRKDGKASTCKACVNNRVRPYDSEKNKNMHLKKLYGITLDEYNAMLEAQGHCCAICKGTEGMKLGRNMAVDHCHTTGKVRGILCSHCNRGLGFFKDNIESLKAAIKYLGGE
ncbi:endonuclease [Escherichia phage vB_Ec_Tarrare]|uniref:Endonuclease n=1 Tax=Escherichia phage vB_Ec_Tarrare TaxID=3032379 RepID=A0AAF0D4U7_9CAUD|nr:endonuclease [Escherichia phage vB_Ec_Tarrare]